MKRLKVIKTKGCKGKKGGCVLIDMTPFDVVTPVNKAA